MEKVKTSTTITSKFQITIPKKIREILDVKEGDKLIFTVNDNGDVVIKKAVLVAFDELSELISKETKKRGYTKKELEKATKEAKKTAWKAFYDR
ncbi:type II toxin-antitoxin system PrlF family antitoxin [bacterium]|nr:type II toxin-antitoxin system PrlF family antitoxin [bacterium]